MVSCFYYEKTKTNVSRAVHSELTWFHLIAHLLVFSASLRGNEHIDVQRAALIYTVELRQTVPALLRIIGAVFSM